MKKLVLGLLAAALVTLGLVGAPPAQADPYPGTVAVAAPTTKVKSKAGKKAKIPLTAASGNATPAGTAKVVCKAKGKKKVKRTAAVNSKGIAKTGKLAKGKWTCKVTFDGTGVFKDATATVKVKVKK